jgi:sugar/nucleoside kinase (ribokinase family)
MSLVVVGSVALDSVETPLGKRDDMLGGSAVYCTLAASHFTSVKLVGVVGEDFPQEAIGLLEGRNIDLSGLETKPGKTFRWSGVYSDDMNERETLDTALNVFEDFDPTIHQDARAAEYLFLGNISPALQLNVLEQMPSPEFIAMDTMNFWIDGARDELIDVLRKVHAVVINDSEARQLSGCPNLLAAARKIQQIGCPTVLIKKGEHGCFQVCREDCFVAPAYPLEAVVDPTGAGDTFAGGFMGHIARAGSSDPRTLREAVIYGSVMASFVVEHFGVDGLLELTDAKIGQRYDEFRQLVSF